MHRYIVDFNAPTVDETRLRGTLEREFAVSRLSITRQTETKPEQDTLPARSELDRQILAFLDDSRAKRRKQIQLELGHADTRRTIDAALKRLVERGQVEKIRNGVFINAGAPHPRPEDIPPLNYKTASRTRDQILNLLSTPRTAVELRKKMGVSRQRVEQILKRMIIAGQVRTVEVAGERGQHVYGRAERQPDLTEARAKVLSTLCPEIIHWVQDIANTTNIARHQTPQNVKQLSAQGLVYMFRLGQRCYVGLTPCGHEHPQYVRDAPKAQPADPFRDTSKARARFLQTLSVLGAARCIDVTDTLPRDFFDGAKSKSGKVIEGLQYASLIKVVAREPGRNPRYRLTAKGHDAAAVLNRLRPPPDKQELEARIRRRRRERAEARPNSTAGMGRRFNAR